MKYPKVGDIFYWKDLKGNIHKDTCYKIDKDPHFNVVTNYFIYLNEGGGGVFVNENNIIDSNSSEVKEFIKCINKEENEKYWTDERKKKMIDFMWLNIAERDINKRAVEDMFESLLKSGI